MEADIPLETDYKALLRHRLKELKARHGLRFTAQKVAEVLEIEPAYLSRCLNHPSHHPSRDLLFRLARCLRLEERELEVVLTKFDCLQASSADYRKHLMARLLRIQAEGGVTERQDALAWVDRSLQALHQVRDLMNQLDRGPREN